ncbi:hypothetical protein GQ54DRAFT_307596 [Martensiomyces pterosporus]|nr:hypothetical protein GQ54DRAFT_307596 [Martensiomyces pterosporus]
MKSIYKTLTAQSEQTVCDSSVDVLGKDNTKDTGTSSRTAKTRGNPETSLQFASATIRGSKVPDSGLQFGLMSTRMLQDNNTVIQQQRHRLNTMPSNTTDTQTNRSHDVASMPARDVETMVAELRQGLQKYDSLEQEISRLSQEQKTLENYVANMMASNVFT